MCRRRKAASRPDVVDPAPNGLVWRDRTLGDQRGNEATRPAFKKKWNRSDPCDRGNRTARYSPIDESSESSRICKGHAGTGQITSARAGGYTPDDHSAVRVSESGERSREVVSVLVVERSAAPFIRRTLEIEEGLFSLTRANQLIEIRAPFGFQSMEEILCSAQGNPPKFNTECVQSPRA